MAVFCIALLLSSILITQSDYEGGENSLTEGIYHDELEEHGEVNQDLWNKEHNISWISPYEKYLPLMCRVNQQGLIYYVDPYLIIRCHDSVADQYISWLAFGKTFHFGTYEWKAKASHNALANCTLYLGLFEKHHGWADEGLIAIKWDGSKWWLQTSYGSGLGFEDTEITGVDFTVEHTFKIEWTSTEVKLYVDGVLKATNSTKIPQEPMQLFAEIAIGGTPPASEPLIYWRNRSFKEL